VDWKAALRARLIDDGSVAAIADNRVTWVDRPQLSALPAITLQVVTEDRPQSMSGFLGLDRDTVQVDVWGDSDKAVYDLQEAAIAAVIGVSNANGIKFERAFIDTVRDLGERTDTKYVHRASIDMIFHHSVAA